MFGGCKYDLGIGMALVGITGILELFAQAYEILDLPVKRHDIAPGHRQHRLGTRFGQVNNR
jgi:hypothetical protein